MDLTFIAVFCGLFAAIAFGVADFLAAIAARAEGAIKASAGVNIIGALAFSIFYLLALPFSEHHATQAGIWYTLVAAIVLAIAQMTLFQALKIGPVSLVTPLTSIYPLFVALGVVFFFGAHFSLIQTGYVLLIVLGATAASGIFELNAKERRIGKGPFIAILTALLWGCGYLILAKALEAVDWQTASLVQLIVIAIICSVLIPLVGKDENGISWPTLRLLKNKYIWSTGLIQMAAIVMLNIGLGLSLDLAPTVMAVSACYPALTILLALKHFKEEHKLIPLSGALLCIIGIILLTLY